MSATPAWPPKSAPRLFIQTPIAPEAAIAVEGQQAHYLLSVMRVKSGDPVILCDNVTGEWACEASDIGKRTLTLLPRQHLRNREEVPDFWLCAALIKKPRFDMILEKATELGVRRIVPVTTRRAVADKLNPERARAVAIEAAEQCARTALPELGEPVKLEALLKAWPDNRTLFFADEEGGEPALAAMRGRSAPAALLIGPEGGFDDSERQAIRALPQAVSVTLGPRILRAETAAVAATAIWMAAADFT